METNIKSSEPDALPTRHRTLDLFFEPAAVALIGATERTGSIGRSILWNLISSPFGGTVFPVNAHRSSILGIKSYPSIAAVPAPVELAVVVTPAVTVPGVMRECVDAGVKGAIIISAGFKEIGEQGVALEREIAEITSGQMRVLGPNCLGTMCPLTGLNATFMHTSARPGNVAFVSQSGALCAAILDWSLREYVGFSHFVSVGSMLDVGWGDMIEYLGDDPRVRSIILYIESIGDPRPFLSAARRVALTKPIIVIKAGRTEAAAKAAASHTGALAGSDDVLDAAFRRCGVLRVSTIADLFHMADVLAKQPRPRGPRLAILTNAGGPGVLATDSLIGYGGELARLSDQTLSTLNALLPPFWSHANPVDILGDATSDRYAKSMEALTADPNCDGILMIICPQAATAPAEIADKIKAYAKLPHKPVIASCMGGARIAPARDLLNRAGVPVFEYPDTAARVFHSMWQYSYSLRGLYETPLRVSDEGEHGGEREGVQQLLASLTRAGRTLLSEYESKRLLQGAGIPITPIEIAVSQEQAVEAARRIGYPIVLKLHSETVSHKTDVGGVKLDLRDNASVAGAFRQIEANVNEKAGPGNFLGVTVQRMMRRKDAYELIIGSSIDPQFGPVLLFGSGGQLVEVYRDRALALPPLNTTLARRLMEQTRVYTALKGVRSRGPVDLRCIEQLLVRFSQFVVEHPRIKEIDINPLLADSDGCIALDARVVLHESSVRDEDLPKLAIRPYPSEYIFQTTLKDGNVVTVRPIRPEDEPLMIEFHRGLSEQSISMRYFHMISLDARIAHDRLARVCFIDYEHEMVLVAEHQDAGRTDIVGVGRFNRVNGTNEADFAVLVADHFQRHGLGSELIQLLIEVGRAEGLVRISGEILPENVDMRQMCERMGFEMSVDHRSGVIRATMRLTAEEVRA
jgi:acetyltransferase